MSISRVQRLQTPAPWQIQLLIIGFILSYITFLAVLYIAKKHEFTPFEEVKDNYLQVNPFEGHIIKAPNQSIHGKGVVIKLNTLCNSIIQQSPEFRYLTYSQNILGDLCAKSPSEVNFVAYITYEKNLISESNKSKKVTYQLAKKVAVINWPSKELVAQRVFIKNYPFPKNIAELDAVAERKLCVITEEPSDEEVKTWIASLASEDSYYY